MSLLSDLNEDIKTAMKSHDKERLSVLRMVKASLQNATIAKREDLSSDEETAVVSRERKQRNDSLEEFKKADRPDLVQAIEKELAIVNEYLPKQLSEEEVRNIVKDTIVEIEASSMQDMGKVMSALMPKVKGMADGKLVNQLVKEELQN